MLASHTYEYIYIYIQLLTHSPPPCLFRLNSAIAEFIATGIFSWYQMVLMVRRLPRTTRYQPKIPVGMNSAIAELNANQLCDRRVDGNKYHLAIQYLQIPSSRTYGRATCNSASAELQLCDNSATQKLPSKHAPDSNESQISTCNQLCDRRVDFYVVLPCFLRKIASRCSGSPTLRSQSWLAVGKYRKKYLNFKASSGRQHDLNCSKNWSHARATAKF